MTVDDAEFREYIGPRLDQLRRTAYLICGDWHGADDAVPSAVLRNGFLPAGLAAALRTAALDPTLTL